MVKSLKFRNITLLYDEHGFWWIIGINIARYISKFPKYHSPLHWTVLKYDFWVFISNIPLNHAITYTNLESGKRKYRFGKRLEKVFNFATKTLYEPC